MRLRVRAALSALLLLPLAVPGVLAAAQQPPATGAESKKASGVIAGILGGRLGCTCWCFSGSGSGQFGTLILERSCLRGRSSTRGSWSGSGWPGTCRRERSWFLKDERDSLGQLAVIGLWCEEDDCRCFIRPVSGRLNSPDSFTTSAVCAACGSVTIIWCDEDRGLCVRSEPRLRGRNHPMEAGDLWRWVQRAQPPTNREARLIAP